MSNCYANHVALSPPTFPEPQAEIYIVREFG